MALRQVENMKVDVKTVVAIVIWIFSIAGVYFGMKYKVDDLEKQTLELKSKFDNYQFDVLKYKVDELQTSLNKLNEKADKIDNILSK